MFTYNNSTENRKSGIDILKIISMILITMIHYMGYSQVYSNTSLLFANRIIISFFSTITLVAVNIFPMITGYLMYKKEANYIRPFKIWSEGWYYSLLLMIPGLIITGGEIGAIKSICSFFPFFSFHYWYLSAGIILYLISPCLNWVLSSISSERIHKYLIISGFFIVFYYVTNPFCSTDIYIGHYHGVIWLSYMYLIGGYIRSNDVSVASSGKKRLKKKLIYIGLAAFVFIFIIKYFDIDLTVANMQILSDYSFLPLVLTLSVFVLIKDVNIKSKMIGKFFTSCAECSFGVYLIQEHTMLRSWYWILFDANKYADSYLMILQILCSIVVLWPAAWVGHYIFKKLFKYFGVKVYNQINVFCRLLEKLFFIQK